MYLWCSRCCYATHRDRWRFDLGKYGTCPKCGSSSRRIAVEWEYVAKVNGYPPTPLDGQSYSIQPELF